MAAAPVLCGLAAALIGFLAWQFSRGRLAGPSGRPPQKLPLAAATVTALAVWLFVMLSVTAVTFIMPESYRGTARIKIDRDITDFSTNPQLLTYDPYFIQTEFEVIQSELVLSRVIEALDLNKAWGRRYTGGEPLKTSQTCQLLRSCLDMRPIRNTSLIEINVYQANPDEAARIANAIAEAYRDFRAGQRTRLIQDRRKMLEAQLADADARLKAARKELAEEASGASSAASPTGKQQIDDLARYRDSLSLKLLSETSDVTAPGVARVEIVDRATPAQRPCRPNKPLNLFLGRVVGGFAGLTAGGLVLLAGSLRRARAAAASAALHAAGALA